MLKLPCGIALLYVLLLTYLLLAPRPLAPFGNSGLHTEEILDRTLSSYFQHLLAYGVLVGLVWWGFRPQDRLSQGKLIVLSGLHGVVCEGLQCFVPMRYFNGLDLVCNLLGVLAGSCLVGIVHLYVSNRALCSSNQTVNPLPPS